MDSAKGEEPRTGKSGIMICKNFPHGREVSSLLWTTSSVCPPAHKKDRAQQRWRLVRLRMLVLIARWHNCPHALLDPLTQAGAQTGVVLLCRDTFEKVVVGQIQSSRPLVALLPVAEDEMRWSTVCQNCGRMHPCRYKHIFRAVGRVTLQRTHPTRGQAANLANEKCGAE